MAKANQSRAAERQRLTYRILDGYDETLYPMGVHFDDLAAKVYRLGLGLNITKVGEALRDKGWVKRRVTIKDDIGSRREERWFKPSAA